MSYKSPLLKELDKLSDEEKVISGIWGGFRLILTLVLATYILMAPDPLAIAYVMLLCASVIEIIGHTIVIGTLRHGLKFRLNEVIIPIVLRVFCWYALLDKGYVLLELMAR